jgi:hypothetical protein
MRGQGPSTARAVVLPPATPISPVLRLRPGPPALPGCHRTHARPAGPAPKRPSLSRSRTVPARFAPLRWRPGGSAGRAAWVRRQQASEPSPHHHNPHACSRPSAGHPATSCHARGVAGRTPALGQAQRGTVIGAGPLRAGRSCRRCDESSRRRWPVTWCEHGGEDLSARRYAERHFQAAPMRRRQHPPVAHGPVMASSR